MKKIIIMLVIAIGIIAMIFLKIFLDRGNTAQQPAAQTAPAVPVEGYLARDTTMQFELSTVGTVKANESVEIVSEISKKITEITMKEGSYVAKGDLLFKLDDADISARIRKLSYEEKLAAANESRQKSLLEKGGISQEHYDEVATELSTLEAEIALLRVDLAKTEIRAPFSGKIGLRNVSQGAYVTPNTVLASLQEVNQLKIEFSLPERYANDIRQGLPVTFTTDHSPTVYEARVDVFEPAIDLDTRTLLIHAIFDNRQGQLVPGTSVKVDIVLKSMSRNVFLPTQCIIPSLKGYTVYLVRNGQVKQQEVTLGMRTPEFIQALEGVVPGDTVVTTNLLRIKEGSAVQVIKLN